MTANTRSKGGAVMVLDTEESRFGSAQAKQDLFHDAAFWLPLLSQHCSLASLLAFLKDSEQPTPLEYQLQQEQLQDEDQQAMSGKGQHKKKPFVRKWEKGVLPKTKPLKLVAKERTQRLLQNADLDKQCTELASTKLSNRGRKRKESSSPDDPVTLAARERKQKSRDLQKRRHLRNALLVKMLFPLHAISHKPPATHGTSQDYGGNFLSLNIQPPTQEIKRVGKLNIGYQYDTKQKQNKFENQMCQKSLQEINFLMAVAWSLAQCGKLSPAFLNSALFATLRLSALIGCLTKFHTDDLRGPTPVWVMCHGDGGILVRRFPLFKSSVCVLFGKLVVPMEFRQGHFLKVYAMFGPTGTPQKLSLPSACLELLQPFGYELPYGIVGLKQTRIQIIRTHKPDGKPNYDIVESPTDLETINWKTLLEDSQSPSKPNQKNWQLIHGWNPEKSPYVARTHVYFRQIRTVCAGKNFTETHKNVHNYLENYSTKKVEEFFDSNVHGNQKNESNV